MIWISLKIHWSVLEKKRTNGKFLLCLITMQCFCFFDTFCFWIAEFRAVQLCAKSVEFENPAEWICVTMFFLCYFLRATGWKRHLKKPILFGWRMQKNMYMKLLANISCYTAKNELTYLVDMCNEKHVSLLNVCCN